MSLHCILGKQIAVIQFGNAKYEEYDGKYGSKYVGYAKYDDK